jgi:hypothetical protein
LVKDFICALKSNRLVAVSEEGTIRFVNRQTERLFDSRRAMADAVRGYAARTGAIGKVPGGLAERYWVTTPA